MIRLLFVVCILTSISQVSVAQLGEIPSKGDPETWFTSIFQVIYVDSTISIYHKNVDIVSDYCGVAVSIFGNDIIKHVFSDNVEWELVRTAASPESYIAIDGSYLFIIEVQDKWFYLETPSSKMYFYGLLPEHFEITIPNR